MFKWRSSVKQYTLLLIFTIFLVTMSLVGVAWYVHTSKESTKYQTLHRQAELVSQELSYSFDYVVHLMRYMGEEILKHNPDDISYIATLLQGELITGEMARKHFSWAMFDWSTPDRVVRASTPYGVLDKNISVSHRQYAKMAELEPWRLHFDTPDIGITSGQWIIPAGMGIADKQGKLLGIISMGFNINKLKSNISAVVDTHAVHFLVLDQHRNIVMDSSEGTQSDKEMTGAGELSSYDMPAGRLGVLDKPVNFAGNDYDYYVRIDGYPYTILMADRMPVAYNLVNGSLFITVAGYGLLAILAVVFLLALRRKFAAPISGCTNAIDDVLDGCAIRFNETSKIPEVKKHIKRLTKLLNYVQVVKENQEDQQKKIEKLYASNEVSEKFSTEVNQKFLSLLKDAGIKESEDKQKLLTYPTDDMMNRQYIHLKELIERCLLLRYKDAEAKNVRIDLSLDEFIPLVYVDSVFFSQVILGLIHQSLLFTPSGGSISVYAGVMKIDQEGGPKDVVKIDIQDTGFGIGEDQRQHKENNNVAGAVIVNERGFNMNPDKLALQQLRHLIALHQGVLSIKAVPGEGTFFEIMLPCVDSDSYVDLDLNNGKKNIVSFPRNNHK